MTSSESYKSAGEVFKEILDKSAEKPFTPFTPFPKELPSVLSFPTHAMPKACQALIREAAASIGCPADFVGLPMLVMLGSAVGNSRRLKVKGGWTEGAAINAAVIADPGDKKTPAQSVAVEPATKEQARLRKEHLEKIDEYKRELREYEVDKKDAAKSGLAAPPPPEAPALTRTTVGDTTIEALARILAENPRGVGVFRDELAGWVRAMDQYRAGGKGSDRQFWLSIWSNEPAQFDRKGDPDPVFLLRPFAGVFGSIQPEVLPELQNNRDDGLLERFLFAYPEPVLSDWTDDEIRADSRGRYTNLYLKLRALTMGEDDNGDPEPRAIQFTTEAKELFVDVFNEHQAERRSPGFPRELRGVWPKLSGYMVRISLILAMSRVVTSDEPEQVEAQDVVAAASLLEYAKNQAHRVYVALHGENPDDLLALDLVKLVTARGGAFVGTATELYDQLDSDHKPNSASWLTKKIQSMDGFELVETVEGVKAEHTETGRSTRRALRISLRNGVNGVNGWRGQF